MLILIPKLSSIRLLLSHFYLIDRVLELKLVDMDFLLLFLLIMSVKIESSNVLLGKSWYNEPVVIIKLSYHALSDIEEVVILDLLFI